MNKVKEVRKKLGVSRYRLSEDTGISYKALTAIENGGDVKLSTLNKIAIALDVVVKELL